MREAHAAKSTVLFTECRFLKRIFLFDTSIGQRRSKVKRYVGEDPPLFDPQLDLFQDLTPIASQYARDQGRQEVI
jgi:hypothetical protein